MSKQNEIEVIIINYFSNEATQQELDLLAEWLGDSANKKEYHRFVKTNFLIDSCMQDFQTEKEKEKLLHLIQQKKQGNKRKQMLHIFKYAAMIAGVILAGTLLYQHNFTSSDQPNVEVDQGQVVVVPGVNKAVLTLSDGTTKALKEDTDYRNEEVELDGDKLIYTQTQNRESARDVKLAFNTITVPRGGEFQLRLSDGSQVWLNSESKLRYPVNFLPGSIRKVELLYGEAYFDVSSSENHQGDKFLVHSGGQDIKVLGTEFNVNAYADEPYVYSTLVEGKITILVNETETNIQPNEQAIYTKATSDLLVTTVDVHTFVSWRKGIFSFKGRTLKDLMKVLSRWYDVEVVIDPSIEDLTFKGQLRKHQNLEEILYTIKNASIINSYKMTKNTIYIN